jgi:hypothetical protein
VIACTAVIAVRRIAMRDLLPEAGRARQKKMARLRKSSRSMLRLRLLWAKTPKVQARRRDLMTFDCWF